MTSVALGQVTPQGTYSSRNHHLLLTKEGRDRVWLSQSVSLQPPPLAWSEERQCGGEHPAACPLWQGLSVQGSGPCTRSVYACSGTATASLLLPRRAPHPLLVRLKPYRNGCFISRSPRNKILLLSSFPFSCLVRWRAAPWPRPFLPCLQGQGPF